MSDARKAPADLRYSSEHGWVRSKGDAVEVGITAFAADQLGDVVFIQLPEAGHRVEAGEPYGVVESVKSVSDLYAPVSGLVVEVNDPLLDNPEWVNEDSYGSGWMIRVKQDDGQGIEGLLDAQAYLKGIAS